MSTSAAGTMTPGGGLAELAARVGRVEAEGLRQSQALAECVMRLAKAIAALQDQVVMIREAAGLAPSRRDL